MILALNFTKSLSFLIVHYFRKYSPPMDHTELGTQKISKCPRKTAAIYAGFQTLVIQVLGEFHARF